jgi:Fe(3+) dicitrate transport protein
MLLSSVASVASADEPPAAGATPSAAPPKDEKAAEEKAPVEVRVIGNRPDSLQRIPGSGTVVTQKEIERAQPYDTGEMLRRVPGVQVRQDYGGGNRIDISIRGLEAGRSRKVLILEDGIPVALNPYAEADLYFAPAIERMRGIEVVKGSGSILYGPQTVGGVVNFLTLNPPPGSKVVVDAEGGQRAYARGLASFGETKDNVRYIAQASYKRGDGFRDIGFNVVDTFGKLAFDTSSKGTLTMKLGFHTEGVDSDAVGLTREMYAADPYQPKIADHDRMRSNNYQVAAIHEQRFSKETKLKTLLYAYRTDRIWRRQDYTRNGVPGESYERIVGDTRFPSGAIYFRNSDTILDRVYDVVGVEPRVEHRLNTGDVAHTFDVGARVLYERANYDQRTGSNPTSYAGSLDYAERHQTFAVAGYVQDRIAFRDNLLVTPGVRFERASFGRTILRQQTATGPKDVFIDGSSVAAGVIPGIGIIYGSKTAHVFGGLHLGWAPPRVVSSISPAGTPSELGAEESINYEIGTRIAHKKWLRAETTGFLSNFRNQIVTNTAAASSGQTEQVNGGPTRIVGIEGSSLLALGKLFAIATDVDLGARYTFSRATFVGGPNGGLLLPYAPLHSFNASLDIEHPVANGAGGLGGELAYTHVSSQFADVANTIDWDTTGRIGIMGPRNIVDVTAHYHHKPSGLTFRLTVKNAFDDVYVISRRPEGIFPSGFRQIVAGVRWTYEKVEGNGG